MKNELFKLLVSIVCSDTKQPFHLKQIAWNQIKIIANNSRHLLAVRTKPTCQISDSFFIEKRNILAQYTMELRKFAAIQSKGIICTSTSGNNIFPFCFYLRKDGIKQHFSHSFNLRKIVEIMIVRAWSKPKGNLEGIDLLNYIKSDMVLPISCWQYQNSSFAHHCKRGTRAK